MKSIPNIPLCSAVAGALMLASGTLLADGIEEELEGWLEVINEELAFEGADYRAEKIDYIIDEDDAQGSGTVIATDWGNKQLPSDFVPFDPRRLSWSGSGDDDYHDSITYAVDTTQGTEDACTLMDIACGGAVPPYGGLDGAQTEEAIDNAMSTWDEVSCSDLPIIRNDASGVDIGVAAFRGVPNPDIVTAGGSPRIVADIQHAGWGNVDFPNMPRRILAGTLTFLFIDTTQNPPQPTDIDENGKPDAMFREIYYDPTPRWSVDGTPDADVETLALHEAGHGLSQNHFGKVVVDKQGQSNVIPLAVMNRIYTGQKRSLLGTDIGGHCSNWASYPEF